jgi:hypothetical protein
VAVGRRDDRRAATEHGVPGEQSDHAVVAVQQQRARVRGVARGADHAEPRPGHRQHVAVGELTGAHPVRRVDRPDRTAAHQGREGRCARAVIGVPVGEQHRSDSPGRGVEQPSPVAGGVRSGVDHDDRTGGGVPDEPGVVPCSVIGPGLSASTHRR